jgi:hypothetical protein
MRKFVIFKTIVLAAALIAFGAEPTMAQGFCEYGDHYEGDCSGCYQVGDCGCVEFDDVYHCSSPQSICFITSNESYDGDPVTGCYLACDFINWACT